ncbi:ribonuclease H-like domain-containing protein [Tanacetum coccineum]
MPGIHIKNGVSERKNRTLIEAAKPRSYLGKFDGKSRRSDICWDTPTNSKGESKGKMSLLDFDLDLLNSIPELHSWVRKDNYADTNRTRISCDDVDDLETTIHLMHQESLAKAHKVKSKIAFEDEKSRIPLQPGKEHFDETSHLTKQEEQLQIQLQEVWVLCDLPEGKRVIGTKWVFRNKRDEWGTIIKNKARLVAQGYRQEEGLMINLESSCTLTASKTNIMVCCFVCVQDFKSLQRFLIYMLSKGSLEELVLLAMQVNKHCGITSTEAEYEHCKCVPYKDETYDMLHDLIVGLENRLRHKVKTIRCDNGTEFKNQLMNEFCAKKGIKREYSIARTPQQNGVAERKNRTLIEAARTMLADSLLPIQFWAEAVNTACYVLNRVLVTKPQMKTPYEILMGRSPNISFMRPFGCSLTILNTLDQLCKFDGKSEEGFSPQWKYLVHVLLHCLSPKRTSWEQFGTNIASALVGLATNQKFNFSLLIMNGMLGHISNGTPFLMYPRFVQLFLNKQLEGVDRPQDFIPSVSLPSKVFTFMRKHSPKFSCRITPLTPSMLEVVTALAAEEEHSTSPHSRAASSARDAQGTPTQSAAHSQRTASVQGTASFHGTANSQGTAEIQGTADFQGTAEPHDAASIPKSPNDYTPTDASQTSGGDEGLLDIYALNREVKRLKRQTLSQAKQIIKLKAKLKKLSKFVQPVVKHHAFWVENQNLKKQKRRRKKHKKKVSSVKLGRNKDEGTLSEEHYVQEEDTADPFFDDIADKDAAVTPDLERKSDETEEVNIEEKEASNVKSGETEELDLETTQSTARQGTITPRTLNFEDEAGPSSPLRPIQVMESEEQLKAAEVLVSISRPRGLSIPGPIQTQPQQPTQGTDPKDKGKGILVEEPKKKKLTLQQIRALETTNDEEVARKIQAEWDAEEERKRFEELKKTKPKTTLRKPTSLAQERNQMMSFLKGQGYKNLQKLKYPQMKELYDKVQASIKDSFKDFIPMDSEKEREMLKERDAKRLLRKRKATISEEQPSKKPKLRTETIDELRNYLSIL